MYCTVAAMGGEAVAALLDEVGKKAAKMESSLESSIDATWRQIVSEYTYLPSACYSGRGSPGRLSIWRSRLK